MRQRAILNWQFRPSVRPSTSVCMYVDPCIPAYKRIIESFRIFSPVDNPIILVFCDLISLQNTPNWGRQKHRRSMKIQRFAVHKSFYPGNGARCKVNGWLCQNHASCMVPRGHQWPWVTFQGHFTILKLSIAKIYNYTAYVAKLTILCPSYTVQRFITLKHV